MFTLQLTFSQVTKEIAMDESNLKETYNVEDR